MARLGRWQVLSFRVHRDVRVLFKFSTPFMTPSLSLHHDSRFSKFYVATSSFPSSTFVISRLQHLLCHTLLIEYSHTMSGLWSIYCMNLVSLSSESFQNHLTEPHLITLPKRHVYTHINAFQGLQCEIDDLNDEENELEDLASLFSCQALVFSWFSLSRT